MHPQVTFRGLFPSEAMVQEVWRRAGALHACRPDISGCHVSIERLSPRKRSRFRVMVSLSAAENMGGHSDAITCDDVSIGLHEAFREARRLFLEVPPFGAAEGA
jgi:hypothetical protein